jgi:tRNA (guanine6-N2)-methyltransferase
MYWKVSARSRDFYFVIIPSRQQANIFMVQVFAIATRGLEEISAQEVSSIEGVVVKDVAYRRITISYNGPIENLVTLRTVDDIFFLVGTWTHVATQRSGLDDIRQFSSTLELLHAVQRIIPLREIPLHAHFSVTASFVGKRNYNTEEIKQAVADGIQLRFPWLYNPDDQTSDINIRLFIEHANATVGVRINQTSLQKRAYKQRHTAGSLKPPIAAAMVFLANPDVSYPVLDPFCGAGTILIEAKQMGFNILGGDIDTGALQAARENISSAKINTQILRWNALHLPFEDSTFEAVITNIPWGRQISTDFDAQTNQTIFLEECSRVLIKAGKAVILTNHVDIPPPGQFIIKDKIEISLFGQNPSILVLQKKE